MEKICGCILREICSSQVVSKSQTPAEMTSFMSDRRDIEELVEQPTACSWSGRKNGKPRIVFDARPANDRVKRLRNLHIFTLEGPSWRGWRAYGEGAGYAWSGDFRHLFCQLKLHPDMQRLLELKETQTRCAFRMCGQWAWDWVISWFAVLAKKEGQKSLGVRPEEVTELPIFLKI